MVKEKNIRPTKARLLGNIIPDKATLLAKTRYEDFHTIRTNGGSVKFKNETVSTLNLNSNWIDTALHITEISGMTLKREGTVVVHLFKEADNNGLSGETVTITIGDEVNTCTTNSNGFASAKFSPPYHGTYTVTVEYTGNSKKSYKRATTVTDTFTVDKLGVTITQADLTGIAGQTFTIHPTFKDSNGDIVENGLVEFNYGTYNLATETVAAGSCTFTRTINQAVTYTYTINYKGTSVYHAASKTFKITANRKTPSIILDTTSTTTAEYNNNLTIVVEGQNINFTSDNVVLELYSGSTKLGTFTNNGTLSSCTITPNWIGNKTLTVKLLENMKYEATEMDVSTTVTKATTSVEITLGDIWDYPTTEGFNIKVRNNKNQYLSEGTLTLKFKQETIDEEETIATFDLSTTTGNIDVNRKNLDLDTLYSTLRGRRYLYYTGYKIIASYTGNTYYKNSSQEKQPVNIHAYASIIKPVFEINQNSSYDMSSDYSRVPVDDTSLAQFHISVNQYENTMRYVKSNRTYGFDQDTPINMGTVSRGDIIWMATEYYASHTPDSQKNLGRTELTSIGIEAVGGINTEIHYSINSGTEVDTAEAQLNGASTRYTVPRYTKFTVPNTVNAGDTIQLIFYTGVNAGYYNTYNNTYGFRYAFEWEVI